MQYERSQMRYDDGYYKWTAKDDRDNPYYRYGVDSAQLNRTEGYEVLYFINHIAQRKWQNTPADLSALQKIEKMLRYDVPGNIRKREHIEGWIINFWSKY